MSTPSVGRASCVSLAVDDHRRHVLGRNERAGEFARTVRIVIRENGQRDARLVRLDEFQLLDALVGLHAAAAGFEQRPELGLGGFVVVAVENVAVGDRVSVRRDLAREGEGLVGIRLEAGFDQRRSVSGRETCERGSRNPLAGGVESHHGEGVLHLGHQAGQRLLERSPAASPRSSMKARRSMASWAAYSNSEIGVGLTILGGHVLLFGRQPDLSRSSA